MADPTANSGDGQSVHSLHRPARLNAIRVGHHHLFTKYSTLLALVLSPLSATADPALFCAGTYSVVSGTVTGTAAGSRIDLVRTTNDGLAIVVYEGCTAAALTLQGRTITLNRAPGGDHWSATTAGGGGTLEFRFDAGPPTQVAARMFTTDGTLTLRRGSQMSLQTAAEEQPLECFDGDAPSQAQGSLADGFASAIGKSPHPDHSLADYSRISETDPGDATAGVLPSFEISYPLSLSLEMLPRVANADTFQAACEGRTLEPTRKTLSIKVFPVDPGYTAFARIIDVETSKIEVQAEGMANGQTPEDAIAAMLQAYGALGVNVGAMGDVWAD